MQALKVLVAIMGLMILAGLTLLGAMMASRIGHRGPTIVAAPQAFSAAPIDLPAGARITTIKVASDRLILDIVLPGGDRQLIVMDLVTGRRLGVIPLHVKP